MATFLTSNIFSDIYVRGNCVVQGTLSSLGGSITSQWTTAGSVIYYNGGNVGIGTVSPVTNLDVTKSTAFGTPAIEIRGGGGGPRFQVYGRNADAQAWMGLGTDMAGAAYEHSIYFPNANSGANGLLTFGSYNGTTYSEKMRILTSGNIGIGTTNPGSLLSVSGGVGIGSGYTTSTAPTNGLIVQGNVGIGTNNPGVNALQVIGNVATSGFTSNAAITTFNCDTLTLPFVNATQVGVGTTSPAYALDTVGDINASTTLRIGGLIQPRLISSGTFTGVTTFDTVTFDLVNFNVVEIRMTVFFSTTNQRVMSSQLLDTAGTVYSGNETGWQVFASGSTASSSGGGANIMNNTETVGVGVGGFIVVIRLIGAMGISGVIRNHWDWATTGCYAGLGASTTFGRAAIYNNSGATMNRMRFNLSGGTMTGKYSIINYSS